MDRENSPETVSLYDYMEAHNIRSVGNDESDANYLSNLEGNLKVTLNLPLGQSRCVGSAGFENTSNAYFVRYNSMGYHQIVEFDYETSTETVVFENLTDSADEDIFPLEADTYFSDIRLMHDQFLIMTNGDSPIFTLNVDTLKENRGSRVVTREDLLLHKNPSLYPPTFEYLSNTSRTSNTLRGNLFQFKVQYEYEDYRTSTWGPNSKRNVPEDEPSDGQGQNVALYNVLKVRVDVGTDRVDKINIGVRTGLDNWLLARTVDRERVVNLPNTDIPDNNGNINSNTITEAYNPSTNEYIFLFYNDGLYPIIDQVEVESKYDYIPHTAETVEVINGNMLALGGLTEGYDRPELEEVTVTATYYEPDITGEITGNPNKFAVNAIPFYWSSNRYKNWHIHFEGDPKTGDVFVFQIKQIASVIPDTHQYEVTSTDESNGMSYTLANIVNYLASVTPGSMIFNSNPSWGDYISVRNDVDIENWDVESAYVRNASLGTLSTQSKPTLKSGASYQLAYAPFDENGKFFPIVTDERFIVKTDSKSAQLGKVPQINWRISPEAPEGAVGYHILMSENQTYEKYVTLIGQYDSEEGGGDEYLVINLTSLARFNEFESESQVMYDFTKGDKVTFVRVLMQGNGNTINWFRYPFIELDIVDFEIRVNPDDVSDTKYLLKVRNTELLNAIPWKDNPIELEILTPKKQVSGVGEEPITEFFYEIGQTYPVINGQNSVTEGSIIEGDAYYKGRLYEHPLTNDGILAFVQDPNFSDNYVSNFWSAGRGRTYNDEQGRTERKASIRYSDEFVYGSKYNGMGRFYAERIYGERGGETTSKYGWIRKLESRDNSLICIQEFKVGVIPVYKSIIYDNTDTSLVADSGRIFGSVQLRNGNFGCGDAKESIVATRDGLIYFFDDNNCLPIRDSLSGIDVIDRNMTSYFVKYAKEARDKGAKFIGFYDNYNNEYNLSIESVNLRIIQVSFEDSTYEDSFIPPYQLITLSGPYNGTATIDGYNVTYTPNEDYVGSDLIHLNFTSGGEPVTKTVGLIVSEGDSVPNLFGFPSQNNRQLSTMVESTPITVGGINMPTSISIVNGEYQVNGGDWVTTPGTVDPLDSVRVRHVTSGDYETPVTTTLNIGGVEGTFTTTTLQEDTSPEINNVYGELSQDLTGRIVCTLKIDYPITVDFNISGYITYELFGSTQTIPVSFLLSAGMIEVVHQTSVIPTTFSSVQGELNVGNFNDTPTLCTDDEVRLLHKVRYMGQSM